jgi:hypothetical protein
MASTEISGFYGASPTVANVITFYVQTPMPPGIQYGWVLTGLSGVQGQTRVVATTLQQGNYPKNGSYNGTIDFQVNVPQTIQGVQQAGAVTVAPQQVIAPPPPPSLTGAYFTQMGLVIFYSNVPLPPAVVPGWTITGLPGMPYSLNVASVSFQSGNMGRVPYLGILTAAPLPPQPLSTPPDPSALAKLMSVLRQVGTFGEVLGGKLIGLDTYVFSDPPKLSTYLSQTQNLLNFFVSKTGLTSDSILADPTQLRGVLSGLPEITNALGFRMRTGSNRLVDGFLNDESMLMALGQGRILLPVLPSTDAYPNGVPVNAQGALFDPTISTAFVPAQVSTIQPLVRAPIEDSNFKVIPNHLRDLNEAVPVPPLAPEPLTEKRNLGFNSGGVLSLDAIGPQEEYLSNIHDFSQSQWSPNYEQYTNSVLYQDYIKMSPIASTTFIQPNSSGTCIVEIQPKNQGDLLANMFLKCSLPALPQTTSNSYTNQIGRALIQQVDFMIDDVIVESIYDDWLFIKDQAFLDYDEQIGMFNQVNGGQPTGTVGLSPTSPVPLIIPLEFFFCRRHSGANKGRERLRKPFFPLCALWAGQRVYIKFTFRPQYWFTNASPGTIDIRDPVLLLEYVKITDNERLYYRNSPLRYIVPVVKRDGTAPYAGTVTTNISANFPVQLIAWFIRNQVYESTSPAYYSVRYLYGYATQYQTAATPLNFAAASQTTSVNYTDVIQTVKITINNQDILDTFANGPYTSFLQPMQHGLSVPQKNIYMYSFGLNITEYNSGGYLNFSKINSQTSNLTITFLPQFAKALSSYNLYLFYYGFSILEFKDGFAGVSYL